MVDHSYRFESCIPDAFLTKEHVVTVFFDLERAYETTLQYGILKDHFEFGFDAYLFFHRLYFNDRHFCVRLSTNLSDTFSQEMGVPQGNILSVTLFSIEMINIVSCLKTSTEGFLYVGDFSISYRSKHKTLVYNGKAHSAVS
ncbi:hypothetical protein BOW02_12415 [Solemya velum gill symbiont]|nr:hypothetical protein BOW02_12415 [Solemya velum gill symbiont]